MQRQRKILGAQRDAQNKAESRIAKTYIQKGKICNAKKLKET